MTKIHAANKQLIRILMAASILFTFYGCGGFEGSTVSSGSNSGNTATGTVALNWESPTYDIEGNPINDLAGYKIYYGPGSGNYTNSVDTGDTTGATINDLSAGTWCFSATAYDLSGNESSFSNEVCAVFS